MLETLARPEEFLDVRVHRLDLKPGLTGVCAGYERGEWRANQLARHILEWLPEFALKHSELENLGHHNAVRLIAHAAQVIYKSPKYENRGELGEILLHIVCRQVFDTIPAISKIYYKDSANDTVKGFDAVHVVVSDSSLELWLGEVKFYSDINAAIHDVVEELQAHSQCDYLRSEFAAITNKIDDFWPHAERLKKLLSENTSLDEIFVAVCIPVLLTYESDTIASFDSVSEDFKKAFEREVLEHRERFAGKALPKHVRIHLFLLPMKSKAELVGYFDARLRACQQI